MMSHWLPLTASRWNKQSVKDMTLEVLTFTIMKNSIKNSLTIVRSNHTLLLLNWKMLMNTTITNGGNHTTDNYSEHG